MAVLRDLAEITHWVSVIKITPEAAEDPTVGPDERSPRPGDGQPPADAGADPDVADAAEGAGRGRPGPERDDGRRNGGDPADPCRRPARRPRIWCASCRTPPPPPAPAPQGPGGGGNGPTAARRNRPRRCVSAAPTADRRRQPPPRGRLPRTRPGPLSHLRSCGRTDPRQPRRQAAGRGRDHPAPGPLPARPDRIRTHARSAPRSGRSGWPSACSVGPASAGR